MNIRRSVIDGICFMLVFSFVSYGMWDWQFWAIMSALIVIQFNNSYPLEVDLNELRKK